MAIADESRKAFEEAFKKLDENNRDFFNPADRRENAYLVWQACERRLLASKVVLPERKRAAPCDDSENRGWNACLDAITLKNISCIDCGEEIKDNYYVCKECASSSCEIKLFDESVAHKHLEHLEKHDHYNSYSFVDGQRSVFLDGFRFCLSELSRIRGECKPISHEDIGEKK